MNAAAVAASEISAIADDDSFEKLLIVARIVMSEQRRRVGIGDVVNERAVTAVTSLHRQISVSVNIGKLPFAVGSISNLCAVWLNLRTQTNFLGKRRQIKNR